MKININKTIYSKILNLLAIFQPKINLVQLNPDRLLIDKTKIKLAKLEACLAGKTCAIESNIDAIYFFMRICYVMLIPSQ